MNPGELTEQAIWDEIRKVYDPEIPVNIVDLGLVYSCVLKPLPDGGRRVEVKMTLTTPGCSMADVLRDDVESRIRAMPGVTETQVDLVWDPPWTQAMMTEAARLELGLM